MTSRIYLVTSVLGSMEKEARRIVEAKGRQSALMHVAKQLFSAQLANMTNMRMAFTSGRPVIGDEVALGNHRVYVVSKDFDFEILVNAQSRKNALGIAAKAYLLARPATPRDVLDQFQIHGGTGIEVAK